MTRARRQRALAPEVSETAWAMLTDGAPPDLDASDGWERFALSGGPLQELWSQHGEDILARWAVVHPGTRPSCWWRWEAPRAALGERWGRYEVRDADRHPDPRQRLGGAGTPEHEVLNTVPDLPFGIPARWISKFAAEYYNGRALDVHGRLIASKYADGDFAGLAPDPSDPPMFESEAAYLRRHGLFRSGEAARLKAADYAPVPLLVDGAAD